MKDKDMQKTESVKFRNEVVHNKIGTTRKRYP